MPRIDKGAFLSALTCLTKGWYTLRAPAIAPGPGLDWRFYIGAEVHRIAREHLGQGVSLPRSPVADAVAATAGALGEPEVALTFEATFVANPFVARADALRRNGASWDIIEVKQGKLPEGNDPNGVKEDYIDDLAFTTFVARASGVRVARCVLVLVRGDYRVGMPLTDLLADLDVTEQVLFRAREFDAKAQLVADALLSDVRPTPVLILACKKCSFFKSNCLGAGVTDSILQIPGLREKRLDQLRSYGRISALPTDVKLTPGQQRVVGVIRSGNPLIEPDGLKHLDDVIWPAYYLDFETVMPVVPWFPDTVPYESIPFQFSIHRCAGPGSRDGHYEYLAPNEGDWREELGERLVGLLGDKGSILMYSPYELRVIKYLAATVPRLASQLNALAARLYDLEPIFKNGYCHPGFRGRTSIKETLPAMVPDLSYDRLAVHAGDDAAGLFALMRVGKYSPEERERHRAHLREYCELDTLAMVRLHEALAKIRNAE